MGLPKDPTEEDDDAFMRKIAIPVEDCRRLGIPWSSGYRWFRSPNVVPIERYRKRKQTSARSTAPSAA